MKHNQKEIFRIPPTQRGLPHEQVLLEWSAVRISGSRSDITLKYLVAILVNLVGYGTLFTIWWAVVQNDTQVQIIFSFFAISSTVLFIKIAGQKTTYRYQIYKSNGSLDYHLHYSKLETTVLKAAATLCALIFLGAALVTGSLLFLIGPAAVGLIAALRLLMWKNPMTHIDSLPWHDYNFVTVDRKRRIIVTHCTDVTLGFEARLPDDELFENYLKFLRTSLPPTAEFTEKKWDLDLL